MQERYGTLLTGTLEHLRGPLAANIRPGDKVLVLTDTAHDPRVWQAVLAILGELGVDATLAMFEPRPADYFDPPPAVIEAMRTVDVNVLLTSTGMLHSAANAAAMAAGVPAICMDGGMTLEMFQSGAVCEDLADMATIRHNVAARVFGADARECRVTSSYGTDLTYDVTGRIFVPPLKPDGYDHYRIVDEAKTEGRASSKLLYFLHPTGEFNVPPVEYSANGKLVVDLTMHNLGRLRDPIELTIESGRITAIEGGAEARSLRDYLEEHGDDNAYLCPAEASVGINRRAKVRGIQREDKNIFGCMHFGLGTNVDVGGSIVSSIHLDGVVLAPTLYVDGELRIKDGEFMVPVEPGTELVESEAGSAASGGRS
jgi:leucyl aminopeptidase (aminopeptidase T)